MKSCLRLLATLCSVLMILSSSACATTQMPKVYNGGNNNKTIVESPGAKICEGEGACKEETHNHYEGTSPEASPAWYESGWFWLGLCAVGGLGAAIYYYAGAESAATVIVLN